MFHRRPLPLPGQPQPHRVIAPRAGSVIRARVLSTLPELLTVHWCPDADRHIPHLEPDCPGCYRSTPLPLKGLGYFAVAMHERAKLDSLVSERAQFNQLVCLCLPESLIWQLCQDRNAGTDWRGLVLDVFHANDKPRSRLMVGVIERADAVLWPDAWDVNTDLQHIWSQFLPGAHLHNPHLEREPGQEVDL